MKVVKTWEELMGLYAGRGEVRQTETGFELVDKTTGIIFDLPKEYRVFIDGKIVDPVKFLALPYPIWNGLFGQRAEPQTVECICGKAALTGANDDIVEFCPADLEADITQNDVVLVKAHWDMSQGIMDYDWDDWMHQHFGHNVIWSFCKTNDYHSVGDWYWMIRAEPGDAAVMDLYIVLVHYARTLLAIYNVADEVAEDFERNKAGFRWRMRGFLNGFPGRIHWIVASEEGELWPKFDANRELWTNDEYDWQVIEFDDYLEVRSRGGSPGEIAKTTMRYDAVGMQLCYDLLQ